ncbi:metallophosphoesterase family protein [Thermofilum pendens]|uniref:Metallophosphoesterase n=1 Tax=Thermofilum pendens (strain DSM 2475 / Hrk 5) TaxID=368408 RepID=A1S0I8_THEPD|nr:DNA repair exonuclease [Thermofilum pendens]ABL78968.1 metallophosphoesterase [Thermofilum pendens Hrk 5]
MEVLRIVHTADNHLDPKFTFLGPKVRDRREDFLNAFRRVVDFAVEAKPHLFLVSGDLFDSVNPRNPVRVQVIRAFRRLYSEGVRVYVIAGNHDMPRSLEEGLSPLKEVEASGYARFFEKTSEFEVDHFEVNGFDVAVAGISYNPEVGLDEHPLRKYNARVPREGDIEVVLMHYNFAGVEVPGAWRAPRITREDIPDNCVYAALGHVHSRVTIPLGNGGVAAYPGSTERRSFIEEGDGAKGFLYVKVHGDGRVETEFKEVPTRPIKTVRVQVPPSAEDPVGYVLSSLPPPDPRLLLRVLVEGSIPLARLTRYSRAELLKNAEKRFFHVVVEDSELRCAYAEKPSVAVESKSPIEAFREEVEGRLREAPEEDRIILLKALERGVKALEESGAW